MHFGLRIALSSLRTHKLRTVLAMLGVFLGALALTGVQHVSMAMERKAEIETEKLGPNLFMARAGGVRFRRSGGVRTTSSPITFKISDAEALIEGLPGALEGTPFIQQSMGVRSGATKITALLMATTPDYQTIRSVRPQAGRFFNTEEVQSRAMVCVLGEKIAQRLFGGAQQAVGREVSFYRARAKVVGVMEPKGADIVGTDQDELIYLPLSTYMRRMSNQDHITGAYIRLARGTNLEVTKDAATTILRSRHSILPGSEDDFSVLTAKDTIKLQTQALDLVGTLGLISSSVSFAVGGLGILSIMILLVRARRLEIGVRRAVGARRGDIIAQFLFEAGLLSGVGGTLGVACSMGLVLLVHLLADFPFVVSPLLLVSVLIGSVLLGLAAGVYPAWQASRFEVLDILRSQN
ncbi:ABC transporter permease [Desulfovibrio ferrophilus]|uniref:ABC-type antimicrobial peptide transport system, permease component n=1 Tax=Desulfovibrio ferrophilus TaxID=241368 RepID=A0A2Z6B2Z9_9BACT|nr:ABC transporter permease [Desulfovibrio ferrophilus]BBD09818.1 ABC-type antimicrobial peptide transport system, permease component [Desulfovibrio ferrophilus]